MTTTFVQSEPRARKTHLCESCGRTIRVGEHYSRVAGLDGTAWTYKECLHCKPLTEYVARSYDLETYTGEDVANWEPESLEQLRIKAQWRRRWTRLDGTLFPRPSLVWIYRHDDDPWPYAVRLEIGRD